MVVKDLENSIKDEEEIEDEPSDHPKVHACKTDYDKIIYKLNVVKLALRVISLDDVVKVIGEETIPNVRGKDSFTQIIRDQRFINVLDIMNKIVYFVKVFNNRFCCITFCLIHVFNSSNRMYFFYQLQIFLSGSKS